MMWRLGCILGIVCMNHPPPKRVSQRIGPRVPYLIIILLALFTIPVVGTSIAKKPKNTINTNKYCTRPEAPMERELAFWPLLLFTLLTLLLWCSLSIPRPRPLSHRPLPSLGKGQTLAQGKTYKIRIATSWQFVGGNQCHVPGSRWPPRLFM